MVIVAYTLNAIDQLRGVSRINILFRVIHYICIVC